MTSTCAPQPASPVIMVSTLTPLPPTETIIPVTPTATILPPELLSEIDVILANLAKQDLFSGSVLIAQQGKVLFSQGYGLADREQNIPNTNKTRFRIGSITKQFTAMAILILASQGDLSIQDPICNYLTECPSAWQPITIHHLLTHTAGIPEFMALPDFGSMLETPSAPEQIIALFKDLPLDFQPGEEWSYSNSGYAVLGYIIERTSGKSYEEFLQQSIFDPLKLHDTGYGNNMDGLAVGYPDQYSSVPVGYIDMSNMYAAGALYSTVEDLYRWEQALYTEQLVPQTYLDQMFSSYATTPYYGGLGYGYGWLIGTERGRSIYTHQGVVDGFSTIITHYPNEKIAIIVLSNVQNKDVKSIHDVLSKKVFGDN